MEDKLYFEMLASLNLKDAHPGGFELTKYLLTLLPLNKFIKILEVGCGIGNTASYIYKKYGCDITVIDINDEMINKAMKNFQNENIPIKLIKGNVENMPFLSNSFDIILSESVTAFTNLGVSLTEYARTLNENGVFIANEMTIERHLFPYEKQEIMKVYGVKNIYTEKEWIYHIYKNGFKNVQVIGGTNVTNTNKSQIPPNSIHHLPIPLLNKFNEHQQIINKYRDVLGYRIYLSMK